LDKMFPRKEPQLRERAKRYYWFVLMLESQCIDSIIIF
jgi:hypothetical protein